MDQVYLANLKIRARPTSSAMSYLSALDHVSDVVEWVNTNFGLEEPSFTNYPTSKTWGRTRWTCDAIGDIRISFLFKFQWQQTSFLLQWGGSAECRVVPDYLKSCWESCVNQFLYTDD